MLKALLLVISLIFLTPAFAAISEDEALDMVFDCDAQSKWKYEDVRMKKAFYTVVKNLAQEHQDLSDYLDLLAVCSTSPECADYPQNGALKASKYCGKTVRFYFEDTKEVFMKRSVNTISDSVPAKKKLIEFYNNH
jgi:hypothetical protein